ncbi:MAG TPA: hypothetical protein DCE44_21225 [Verrucomicrobiales bacterium]|nr:hypothetical protein [Verrucomicrobiales bacterium]
MLRPAAVANRDSEILAPAVRHGVPTFQIQKPNLIGAVEPSDRRPLSSVFERPNPAEFTPGDRSIQASDTAEIAT